MLPLRNTVRRCSLGFHTSVNSAYDVRLVRPVWRFSQRHSSVVQWRSVGGAVAVPDSNDAGSPSSGRSPFRSLLEACRLHVDSEDSSRDSARAGRGSMCDGSSPAPEECVSLAGGLFEAGGESIGEPSAEFVESARFRREPFGTVVGCDRNLSVLGYDATIPVIRCSSSISVIRINACVPALRYNALSAVS